MLFRSGHGAAHISPVCTGGTSGRLRPDWTRRGSHLHSVYRGDERPPPPGLDTARLTSPQCVPGGREAASVRTGHGAAPSSDVRAVSITTQMERARPIAQNSVSAGRRLRRAHRPPVNVSAGSSGGLLIARDAIYHGAISQWISAASKGEWRRSSHGLGTPRAPQLRQTSHMPRASGNPNYKHKLIT